MLSFKKNIILSYLLILLSCFLYVFIEYFLPRTSFYWLVGLWFILFGIAYYLIEYSALNNKALILFGVLFRLLLLIAIPPLSQDFNRFIWDGRILFAGLNPYLTTPKYLIENNLAPIHDALQLYKSMGMLNASHYSNYPPISQFGYLIAALIGSKSIVVSIVIMRLQLILSDIGILYFGQKILTLLKLPKKNIFLYFLNPFVILELTGNLHYEPVMVFLLIVSLYFLLKEKWILSALLLGLSINVKLLPLVFIPVFAGYFLKESIFNKSFKYSFLNLIHQKRKIIKYLFFCLTTIFINVLLFLPFFNEAFISNYGSSVGLWFKSFEFNASIYYIIRWIGYQTIGWNIIGTVGKILPLFVILLVTLISLLRNNSIPKTLFTSLLFSSCIYLLLTTTVHPWYLSIPIALSMFTNYKYMFLWTAVIILSYSAYANKNYQENLFFVALEYLIVFSFFIYEYIHAIRNTHSKELKKIETT